MIMDAMKEHNQVKTETYRAIKTAFMNWQTSKEHAGQELTEADEINILKKMIKQRAESIDQYRSAGRNDLANAEADQIAVINEFMPEEATEEEIIKTLVDICNTEHIACDKRNMGVLIRKVKDVLPNADGKLVAQVVSKNLA
jgi:uncharacterized protein YqeY